MKLAFKNYYWRWSKNLFLLLFSYLSLMTLARLGFAAFFGDPTDLVVKAPALREALWRGMRDDLRVLAYLNLVPFLLFCVFYFIPGKRPIRVLRIFTVSTLTLGYLGIFWVYVCDYAFYSYFQDRLNVLFFGLFEDDTKALLVTIWKNYSLPLWLAFALFIHIAAVRIVRIFFSAYDFDIKAKRANLRSGLMSTFGLLFLFLGSTGLFGLNRTTAEGPRFSEDRFIDLLALNGVLALHQTLQVRWRSSLDNDFLKEARFPDWREATSAINLKSAPSSTFLETLKAESVHNPVVEGSTQPHVVLVVSEGLGSYWNALDSRSFNILGGLRRHFREGIHFRNFLPADNSTIGSLVSIAAAQVPRSGKRYLSESEFRSIPLSSAGQRAYERSGYETHFVYGGNLRWRGVGEFLKTQGYQHIWGEEEIKGVQQELKVIDPSNLGTEWGLFDEYVFAFVEERLRTATKPQFILILTTSNHPPFDIPATYRPAPITLPPEVTENISASLELTEKRFLGFQYANHMLSEFLDRIKGSRLRERTVVAVTGDHSYWVARGINYDQEFRRFAVPFFIMVPEHLRPLRWNRDNFGSHEDIFPTLYHLTLSRRKYMKLGRNLFTEDSVAINSSGLIAGSAGAYHSGRFWRWKDRGQQLLEPSPETPELRELKRYAEALTAVTGLYLKHEKLRSTNALANDPPGSPSP